MGPPIQQIPISAVKRAWPAILIAACLLSLDIHLLPSQISSHIEGLSRAEEAWDSGPDQAIEAGEPLIHGFRSARERILTYRLPLGNVLAARSSHWNFAARWSFERGLQYLPGLLLLLLCRLALPLSTSGYFLALLMFYLAAGEDLLEFRQNILCQLTLTVTCIGVWRLQKPSLAKSLLLACAMGVSLLHRATLAFLPPVLALTEWLQDRAGAQKRNRPHLYVLLIAPYLWVIPWIWLNWKVHHKFIPFENGAADSNIVSGALGLVETIEGDITLFIGQGGSAFGWAVKEVLGHPVRYIWAFLRRVYWIFSVYPLFFLTGGLAAYLSWRRQAVRLIAILGIYLIAIQCFMTIEKRYFVPLWPLLAILAASLTLRRGADSEHAPQTKTIARGLLLGWVAIVIVFGVYVSGRLIAYARMPATASSEASVDLALQADPKDVWLLFQRGKSRLARGDSAGAAEDLSRALSLKPGNWEYKLWLAWAQALGGKPRDLLRMEFVDHEAKLRESPVTIGQVTLRDFEAHVWSANICLRLNRPKEALRHLRLAKKITDANKLVRGVRSGRETEILAKLESSSRSYVSWAGSLIENRPPSERLDFLNALKTVVPQEPQVWLDKARMERELGQNARATESLQTATTLIKRPNH